MQGAISQMDTFEYKPHLQQDGGKPGPGGGTLTASKFRFRQHGESRTWFSELLPRHGRSMRTNSAGFGDCTPTRRPTRRLWCSCTPAAPMPRSRGLAWAPGCMYGLGTENQDLPGYVTINPPPNFGGAVNYGSAFLPAHFQGTRIDDQGYLPNLKPQVAARLAAPAARPDPVVEPGDCGRAGRAGGTRRHYRIV